MFLVELITSSFLHLIYKQAIPQWRCKRVLVTLKINGDGNWTQRQQKFQKALAVSNTIVDPGGRSMRSYNTGDECFKALPFTTVEGHMYRAYHRGKRVNVRLTLRWGRVDIVCFISVHQLDPSPLLHQTFLHPSLRNICEQRASKSLLSSHVWLTCIDDFCTGCRNFSHLQQQSPC